MTAISNLQREITEWADRVYPGRTPQNALHKLILEEIPELLHGGLDDPHEWADLLILVVDAAHLRGIDVVQAAFEKMEINRNRSWKIDPKTGLMNHV